MKKPYRGSSRPRAALSSDCERTDEKLCLFRIPGLPEIRKGEDLAKSIVAAARKAGLPFAAGDVLVVAQKIVRSEEHTSELQSHSDLVCRLLLEKKKRKTKSTSKADARSRTHRSGRRSRRD